MTDLILGQNIPLPADAKKLSVRFLLTNVPSHSALESCAFLLTHQGKIRAGRDKDFVFYDALDSKAGVLKKGKTEHQFTVDVTKIPADIEKVLFTLTLETGSLAAFDCTVEVAQGRTSLARFLAPHHNTPTLILLEFYRRQNAWKIRALGQAFAGGLGELAESLGVDLTDNTSSQTPANPTPAPNNPLPSMNLFTQIVAWYNGLSRLKLFFLGVGIFVISIVIGEIHQDYRAEKEKEERKAWITLDGKGLKTLEELNTFEAEYCQHFYYECVHKRDLPAKRADLELKAEKDQVMAQEQQILAKISTLQELQQFQASCRYCNQFENKSALESKRKALKNHTSRHNK